MDTFPEDTKVRRIVVSGDLVVDHHIYTGERHTPIAGAGRGVRHVAKVGGAEGLCRLLNAINVAAKDAFDKSWTARDDAARKAVEETRAGGGSASDMAAADKKAREGFAPIRTPVACKAIAGVAPPDPKVVMHEDHHAFAVWQPHDLERGHPEKQQVWRTSNRMGYGHHEPIAPGPDTAFIPRPAAIEGSGDLIVLDDAGYMFRNKAHEKCWHLPETGTTSPWILLKLSEPIARGDLWHKLVPEEKTTNGYADRLVCLVSAKDLRTEPVRVTPGISWENALEDLSDELQKPALAPLALCRHLVVVFGGDAALWIDREDKAKGARLCFAAADAEGDYAAEFDGEAVGYMTTMAGALAYGISQTTPTEGLELVPWMTAGLQAMRDLLRRGHGCVRPEADPQPCGYPTSRLAQVIVSSDTSGLSQAAVKWPRPDDEAGHRPWMIVESSQRPLHATELRTLVGLAGEVVRKGRLAYGALPHLKFGNFVTAERTEIEMLRGIRDKMRDYQRHAKTDTKPLAIGVFGPPGAGKSFAVREIANSIFGKDAWREFNLSQFTDTADFNGALHQVRDLVLKGLIPVIFWDEFDSQEFYWLRYLLAPLQDGQFQDGRLTHRVGRSVFIFAGGTSWRFTDFGHAVEEKQKRAQTLAKVPDFKSRLDAFYNVSGPNPNQLVDKNGVHQGRNGPLRIDPNDVGFTLRRALLIRGQLGLGPDELLSIDADLLRALLLVPHYHHGARSLEKLIKILQKEKGAPLRRSSLPPAAQLDMYVEARPFESLLSTNSAFYEARAPAKMAEAFHEAYRENARKGGWQIQEHINRPYAELDHSWKEDNIEAARRIPSVLALVGLGVESVDHKSASEEPDCKTLAAHLECNLERLAEAEHDGWMNFRRLGGWRYGEKRDDEQRIHPLMVPYARLSPDAKDRDRNTILDYKKRLAAAGYRIVWLNDNVAVPSAGCA